MTATAIERLGDSFFPSTIWSPCPTFAVPSATGELLERSEFLLRAMSRQRALAQIAPESRFELSVKAIPPEQAARTSGQLLLSVEPRCDASSTFRRHR